ncbi:hypothetical protein RHGRI_004986 [Rhododendron griersonianum]|uniref:RNase H type-1 domain-containing protein n=1 Tax=Rhododendron griersonianum TaxID=479676 RepID=A0AAV6LAM0_9ERIC|nr:hypothetical protein RHGRI_004986 [Rhododendron griersonianum]
MGFLQTSTGVLPWLPVKVLYQVRVSLNQNEVVFNGGSPNPQHVMYMAVREAEEFVKASEGTEETRGQGGDDCGGVGFVIRDGSGRSIAARPVNLGVVSSAFCAEALACRGTLFFASKLGMESIVVEGESLQIVQMAGKKRHCNTEVEVFTEDIWREMEKFRV